MEFLFRTKKEGKNNIKIYFVNRNKLFVKNTEKKIFGIYTKEKEEWKPFRQTSIPDWFNINEELKENAEFPEQYKALCDSYRPKLVRGIREIYDWTYNEAPNWLGLVSGQKIISWKACRDQFAGSYFEGRETNKDVILFCSTPRNEKSRKDAIAINRNVAKFIRKFEETLGDAFDRDFSTFHETNFANVVDIQVSEFWQDFIRNSLFTALLRCGMGYSAEKDNFKEALYCQSYTSSTKPAVEKFLSGFVKIKHSSKGASNGWMITFANGNVKGLTK